MSVLEGTKLLAIGMTGLSKDALHVHAGLAIMLFVVIALKRPLADWRPIAAVALAAIVGEAWDLVDTFSHGRQPVWSANWKDIWNTMFWPATLFAFARFTKVLRV